MPPRHPTVIAYHLVWTVYGTWLPNDPRGSGSTRVLSEPLLHLGEAHYGRKRIQPRPEIVREFYVEAEPRLDFEVIRFDGDQIERVGAAFGEVVSERNYTCYACAILSDHVHLLVRKHRDTAEQMIQRLKSRSASRLASTPPVPSEHPIWTLGGYRGFLDNPDAVRSVAGYIERNPKKAGIPGQVWEFVEPYDGWTFRKRGEY